MTPCPCREELLRFLDGCLDEANSRIIEQHVEACPSCTAALERLTSGDSRLPFPLVAPADPAAPSPGSSGAPPSARASSSPRINPAAKARRRPASADPCGSFARATSKLIGSCTMTSLSSPSASCSCFSKARSLVCSR